MRTSNRFMSMFAGAAAAAAACVGAAGSASATIYTYDDPHGLYSGGQILTENFSSTYDAANQRFSMTTTVNGSISRSTADGFWIVLSDGPNPKNHVNEYAILYGDAVNNRITAYVYDGVNSANSYKDPHRYITSFSGKLDYTDLGGGRSTFSISDLDVSGINGFLADPAWDGVAFGDEIGIWFHPAMMESLKYSGAQLTEYRFHTQGWYDLANRPTNSQPGSTGGSTGGGSTGGTTGGGSTGGTTGGGSTGGSTGGTQVPAPAPLTLLLAGLAGIGAVSRRRKGIA